MRRSELARSRMIWSTSDGRLIRAANTNTDTAIESTVRTLRRLLRRIFLSTMRRNFIFRVSWLKFPASRAQRIGGAQWNGTHPGETERAVHERPVRRSGVENAHEESGSAVGAVREPTVTEDHDAEQDTGSGA